jgi:hypothetical protein
VNNYFDFFRITMVLPDPTAAVDLRHHSPALIVEDYAPVLLFQTLIRNLSTPSPPFVFPSTTVKMKL